MGKIKKILENELVGGTQTTDVYPVTSTKAVYDENNKRLDNIIKELEEKVNSKSSLQGISMTLENGIYICDIQGYINTQWTNKGLAVADSEDEVELEII